MKKAISLFLSAVLVTDSVMTVPYINNLNTVYGASQLTMAVGGEETIYAEWSEDSAADNATVYYKESGATTYQVADSELVRADGNGGRVDIPGLRAGDYDIRIVKADGTSFARKNIPVEATDRSGYAHFNYSGVGAYNDDGTLKSGAKVIYVTNENKNNVELNGTKGIGNILKDAKNGSTPLAVRIIGKVDTQTRDSDGTKKTDIANGVVAINGLTDKVASSGDDSYFNMLDAKGCKNVTIEGIGDDAVIEKWGFTWSGCTGIEVKNLNFTKYPEDACSTASSSKRIWFHNNTFDVGENKYDLTQEQDKHEGDGSTDINSAQYVTLSYNRYNKCHKTSLHGGSDSAATQYNITWHHNYFNNSSSRMPLTRHANVHTYNNYFYKGSKCIDARASSWVFSEGNYFENSTAFLTTKNSSQGNPVIKSYNDVLSGSKTSDNAGTLHIAANRNETYTESSNKEKYHNFDTDTSKFYYDKTNNVSAVTYLTDAATAKADCIAKSGVLVSKAVLEGEEDSQGGEISTETTTEYATESTETTETTTENIPDSNLTPLDSATYEGSSILSDTAHFAVVDNQSTSALKVNDNGYIEFKLSGNANVTVSYKCGSSNAGKFGTFTLNGQTAPKIEGGRGVAFSEYTVENLAAGTYRIVGVQEGGTSVQIDSITVSYKGGTTTETTTETTTVTSTETTTESTTETSTESTTEGAFLAGDADVSGTLTANDAANILKRVLDNSFETPLNKIHPAGDVYLDVTGDGQLGADDAAEVLSRVLKGIKNKF